jgi:hypothetical protein
VDFDVLQANNVNEEAGSFASCIRSSNPYPYRIQLERDVRSLLLQASQSHCYFVEFWSLTCISYVFVCETKGF